MIKKTIDSIALTFLVLTFVVGALALTGCGSDKTAQEEPAPATAKPEAAAPAQTPEPPKPAAEQAGLDMGEKLAVTQHFEDKAKAEINADNAAAELEKLAKEIEADQ